jgi:integral membrane sensor domain MASE1
MFTTSLLLSKRWCPGGFPNQRYILEPQLVIAVVRFKVFWSTLFLALLIMCFMANSKTQANSNNFLRHYRKNLIALKQTLEKCMFEITKLGVCSQTCVKAVKEN